MARLFLDKKIPVEVMFNPSQREQLLDLARQSIAWGLEHQQVKTITMLDFENDLTVNQSCFVTLYKNNQLRGCIGSLQPRRSLIQDVLENAFAAAFSDPRFDSLQQLELEQIKISISVLTPATELTFSSEQQLLEQIRPEIDGLILKEGQKTGTFLPSVWAQLPDKQEFLNHLKQKAGLASDYWSQNIKVSCYQTESFEELVS